MEKGKKVIYHNKELEKFLEIKRAKKDALLTERRGDLRALLDALREICLLDPRATAEYARKFAPIIQKEIIALMQGEYPRSLSKKVSPYSINFYEFGYGLLAAHRESPQVAHKPEELNVLKRRLEESIFGATLKTPEAPPIKNHVRNNLRRSEDLLWAVVDAIFSGHEITTAYAKEVRVRFPKISAALLNVLEMQRIDMAPLPNFVQNISEFILHQPHHFLFFARKNNFWNHAIARAWKALEKSAPTILPVDVQRKIQPFLEYSSPSEKKDPSGKKK